MTLVTAATFLIGLAADAVAIRVLVEEIITLSAVYYIIPYNICYI